MKRLGLVGVTLAAAFPIIAAAAGAETPTTICLPEGPSKPIVTPNAKGECPTKSKVSYHAATLPSSGELETLDRVLPYVSYIESGVAGEPTIRFSGVNLQLVNGEGKTASLNGAGNLVIGYDENASRTQTGSHNLILGEEQAFSSFGGIVAGYGNTISGREASVSGGFGNTASGFYTSISGGDNNLASVEAASVSGGVRNTASSQGASVQGGDKNAAEAKDASIFGGKELMASKEYEALP